MYTENYLIQSFLPPHSISNVDYPCHIENGSMNAMITWGRFLLFCERLDYKTPLCYAVLVNVIGTLIFKNVLCLLGWIQVNTAM